MERRYYDAWNKWHLFDKKVMPWEILGEPMLWDHIQMIQAFENMKAQREQKKKELEEKKKAQDTIKTVFPPRPNNKTESVL